MAGQVKLDEKELRERLTPDQWRVTQEAATERAFTGKYWNCDEEGTYRCVCCANELFRSDQKFDSGCGWPSFSQANGQGRVRLLEDRSYGMVRTEVRCARCDAHLGHLFDDGPLPTGFRFCINSASLDLEPGGAKD